MFMHVFFEKAHEWPVATQVKLSLSNKKKGRLKTYETASFSNKYESL